MSGESGRGEPALREVPELSEVLAELSRREPIFHRAEFGTARADFDRMMAADFSEVGASGKRYTREFVLDLLAERHAVPHEDVWETSEFACRRLAEDLYLLTYTLLQDGTRLSRRTTLWRKGTEGWEIVFHQGTLVQAG